ELLLEDCVGQSRVEILEVRTLSDQFASRSQYPWANHTAGVDCIAQLRVAVNPGMAEVANGRDAALQVFARCLRTHQAPLGRRFHDGEQESWRELPVVVAQRFRFRRNDDVEK